MKDRVRHATTLDKTTAFHRKEKGRMTEWDGSAQTTELPSMSCEDQTCRNSSRFCETEYRKRRKPQKESVKDGVRQATTLDKTECFLKKGRRSPDRLCWIRPNNSDTDNELRRQNWLQLVAFLRDQLSQKKKATESAEAKVLLTMKKLGRRVSARPENENRTTCV